MDNLQPIADLFDKYLNGETSAEETSYLLSYFASTKGQQDLNKLVNARFEQSQPVDPDLLAKLQPMTDRVGKNLNEFISRQSDSKPVRKLWSTVIAAAATIVIGLAVLLYYQSKTVSPLRAQIAFDAQPGGNRAVLTLANGKTIELDSTKAGIIITGAQLTYNDNTGISGINAQQSEISTITTPAGGQYQVQLSDGTVVTLNAASSLTFPSTFSRLVNRTVELDGEGYFEVAKDKQHPFIVKSGSQQVEVLGTHFNISAYANEKSIQTTLVEGSVKVSNASGNKVLVPGQQAQVVGNHEISVENVDTDDATAWKQGYFIFSEDLPSIMRKIARWYDLEVEYRGQFSADLAFEGKIARNRNLSEVLRMMEYTGKLQFKKEGRKLIVEN